MHPASAVDHSNLRRMVCMMTIDEYCEMILRDYPEYISSDQMYRICHISKRTCRYLLETGLVPNIDNGKKTRRFKIKTTDVVSYLNDRENNPLRYKAPDDYYKTDHKAEPKYPYGRPLTSDDIAVIRAFYQEHFRRFPDVLTISQVAQITGYCKNSVVKWCSKKILRAFFIKQKYKVPKEYLLDFVSDSYFLGITVKSQKHIRYNKEIKKLLNPESSCE